MRLTIQDPAKVFSAFLIFGLVNGVLYVVILAAAIDLVGALTPKAVVLLAAIVPDLALKTFAPLFIHLIAYKQRVLILVLLSCTGMLLVSLSSQNSIGITIAGIALVSLSTGTGEMSFLQLTHSYPERSSIGGFSMGTGAAGIVGSFVFMLMTSVLGISTKTTLIAFAVVPLIFPVVFYIVLTEPVLETCHDELPSENLIFAVKSPSFDGNYMTAASRISRLRLKCHIRTTFSRLVPLIRPYMIPLCSVYIAEYTINQGISPTFLFLLEDMPRWLITRHRDIYVVYGFMYQLGLFIARLSATFGIRYERLYVMSLLQIANVAIAVLQSMYTVPFPGLGLLLVFGFYEGLLGGLLYVNTFLLVSEQVPKSQREFSMGCVSISDSFGIMLVGCINWWLEQHLCQFQVDHGRDWCRGPS